MSRIRQMKGFTLIELIVVVIIIGVLAAIAAVAYNQFVGNSRSTAMLASAKQVEKVLAAQSATDDKSPNTTGELAAAANAFNLGNGGSANLTAGNNVIVVVGTRSACLTYPASAPAGSNASSITLGTDTAVPCA